MRRRAEQVRCLGTGLLIFLAAGCYHGYEKATAQYAAIVKQSSVDFSAELDLAQSLCRQQNRVYVFQKRLTAIPPSWAGSTFLIDEFQRLTGPAYVPAEGEENCATIAKVSMLHQQGLQALAAYANALHELADSDGIFGDSIKNTIEDSAKLANELAKGSEGSAASQFAKALASPLSELAKLVAGEWAGHKLKDQIAEADAPVGKLLDALTDYVAITGAQVKSLEGLERGVLQTLEQQMADQAAGRLASPIVGAVNAIDLYGLAVEWREQVQAMRQAQTNYGTVLKKMRAAHADLAGAKKLNMSELKAMVQKVGNDLYVIYSESEKLRKALSGKGGAS
jgi:hypothetical protein